MRSARVFTFLCALAVSQGCLVVSVHPGYDPDSIVWEPALLGEWVDEEDKVAVTVERAEWQSYDIAYVHPIESGELTGYLSRIGKDLYLDLMPARGTDHGAFLVPVHATLRIVIDGDRLEVRPLSYDWFFDRLKKQERIAALDVAFDEKENALIVSPTAKLRAWVAALAPESPMWGAAAVFTRRR